MGLGAYHTAHEAALLVVGTLEIILTLVLATMALVVVGCTPRALFNGRRLRMARGSVGWGGDHLLRWLSTCQSSGASFAALCGSAQWQARAHADHAPRAPRVHADRRHCRAALRPRGPKRGARSPGASARVQCGPRLCRTFAVAYERPDTQSITKNVQGPDQWRADCACPGTVPPYTSRKV